MTKARKLQLFSGARKTARATAAITSGSGRVRVNSIPVELIGNEMSREIVVTPLELAGPLRDKIDIDVTVKGGGSMGQAVASAMAISKALVNWSKSDGLRQKVMEYDEHLLTGDPRQTEPKKFGGPGARRKKQKSYR